MNSWRPFVNSSSVLSIAFALASCVMTLADDRAPSQIDQFVVRRQDEAGVTRQQEASRASLLRRLSFDLIGLPPTPEEVDSFETDRSPHAYEKQVERLLASPRFGEHMATWWLDLARYADSNGYHDDTNRSMWPYRDYVIDAFNKNKPFDEFTIEQLAGDLLKDPTLEQLVATAFHRNAPTSSEDGANPEEYRARYAVDRVNTTSQIWLGLTVQCAECHDHKYDPITTKEYYELFAFFNQTPEQPLFRGLNAPPSLAVPTVEQRADLERLGRQIKVGQHVYKIRADAEVIEEPFENWLKSIEAPSPLPREAIVCEFLFDEDPLSNTGTRRRSAKLAGEQPEGSSNRLMKQGPFGKNLHLLGKRYLDLGQLFEVRQALPFTIETWLKFEESGGPVFSKIDTDQESRGFEVRIVDGRIVVRLVERWPDAAIQVATVDRFEPNVWQHLSVTFDGRLQAGGIYVYVNGEAQDLSIDRQTPTKRVRNRAPFLIGGGPNANFHGQLDEIRFYKWPLSEIQLSQLPFRKLLERDVRSKENRDILLHLFASTKYPPTVEQRKENQRYLREKRLLEQKLPRVRVMREIDQPRETHVLVRGDFRSLGERVSPGTPSLLPELPTKGTRYTRLDLARWLVRENREHTAQVLANRLWAEFFSRGIVATLDDFGESGASATHPELLGWLRDEVLRRDWDVKSVLREIVISQTYRQSSHAGPKQYEADPHNELLARGPRNRLRAEVIRDNALALSGLLSNRIGGPSVRPYQPKGLWREMSKGDEAEKQYQQGSGESLYRRGVYTFWKRSIHYPTFDILDAPSREVCTSSRPTTNTPTQALVLLNDPTFVEAAREFAKLLIAGETDFDERIHVAFRRALARVPTEAELSVLQVTYDKIHAEFEANSSIEGANLELEAWASLAQVILTLDETISRE